MPSLANLSIRRPVATAMFFLIVVTVGMVGFRYLPVDLLPQIEYPQLAVYVNYQNVGPEEMESIATDPLENALSSVPNLERMTSSSEEGLSVVRLEFARGTDISEAANDVRASLDQLRDELPAEAEPPGIWKFDPNSQEIVTISASSTRSLRDLTRILDREVSQRFEQIPGVGTIEISGGIYRQVEVQLHRDRLRAADLTAGEVQQALARENVQLPGGNVKEGVNDLYVRTLGEYESLEQIEETVVARRNGTPVRVSDVARVVDDYEDIDRLAELDGVPVIRMEIQKQSGANTVTVADRVRDRVEQVNADRDDVDLTVIGDQSVFIEQSISSVQNAAIWGGILAVLVLYFFLRNGSATFIIALSIPISIVATFGLLYFADLTLNQMTFGGLALGIGLIVDNAIVVLENVVRLREDEGRSRMEAADVGTREVAGAIIASTLTTSVIFLPVVFMRTTSGQLFQSLALVVVFALGCSLLVALTLVPMAASRYLTVEPKGDSDEGRSRFERLFRRFEHWYAGRLQGLLHHRGKVFGITGAAVLVSVLLWPLVPVELAPEMDSNEIDVEIEMARGVNIAVAKNYLDELEAMVRPVLPEEGVENVASQVWRGNAEVEVRLAPEGERDLDPSALADRIRDEVKGQLPGVEIEVQAQSGLWILRRLFSTGGGNEDLEIQLQGYDLDRARELAAEIAGRIEGVEGIVEADVEQREGRPEQNIRFDREKIYRLGLSVREVAQAIETNVGGSRAGFFRDGGEQFDVMVRLRPDDRLTSRDLRNISVKTPEGETLPVSELVDPREGRGPLEIDHVNGQRVTYITANLASGVALGDAVERVRAEMSDMDMPDDFSVVFGGAYREQQQSQQDFTIAMLMALALVYMVMAGQFERFLDPLVVMFSVPVAMVGVVPTLFLTGTTVNVQSIMGVVMLVGIVVNNAIVLVDYVNLMRRDRGMGLERAAVEAGRLRLRPILMTTVTTVLGLFPLALGLGTGASMQAALARVVIGGLLASTLITLVLIPTLYVSSHRWVERLLEAVRRRFGT
ncbi:MAG: efflux RND transporter permease subunit, partial [Gemmatimonadota bacterium]